MCRRMKGKILEVNEAGEDTFLKIKWDNGLVSEMMMQDIEVVRCGKI